MVGQAGARHVRVRSTAAVAPKPDRIRVANDSNRAYAYAAWARLRTRRVRKTRRARAGYNDYGERPSEDERQTQTHQPPSIERAPDVIDESNALAAAKTEPSRQDVADPGRQAAESPGSFEGRRSKEPALHSSF